MLQIWNLTSAVQLSVIQVTYLTFQKSVLICEWNNVALQSYFNGNNGKIMTNMY